MNTLKHFGISSDRTSRATIVDCDFCGSEAKYDGKTKGGPWAFMCESCFNTQGVGLGIGRGQKLK